MLRPFAVLVRATCRWRGIGGMILTGETQSIGNKTNTCAILCPPRNSHGLTWNRTRHSAVRSRRLTQDTTWPLKVEVKVLFYCSLLPNFRKSFASKKLSGRRPFVLVRATCRWSWVIWSVGGVIVTGESGMTADLKLNCTSILSSYCTLSTQLLGYKSWSVNGYREAVAVLWNLYEHINTMYGKMQSV